MYVGSLIVGLIGIGAAVGGAAAGAHYATAANKTSGAALGAGAGIAAGMLISMFYAASVADNTKQTDAQLTAANRAKLVGVGDPTMRRLMMVGPLAVPTR